MISVDTSVWADHFRAAIADLDELLASAMLIQHPYVTGELALGNLKDRRSALTLLRSLPVARVASGSDLLAFVEARELHGTGIGLVDAHLLAACRLSDSRLWTRDRRLRVQAERLGCAWTPAD